MDVEMEVITCGECGISFALPARFLDERRKDHKGFYCPSGHSRYFPGKSDEEKLREKLKQKEIEIAEKTSVLEKTRQAVRDLQAARNAQVSAYINEQFKNGQKVLMLGEVAKHFKLKSRETMHMVQMAGFVCQRSGKGYQIVKKEKK